ncbi:MAG: PKD domain-containing protein [Chitinophagales bacterium]|nr:PKD domain-containing protein [Chitinophagales bacterium]MDW8427719.1 PKD domain-containing protein [Chitinophagales bacterium]
MFLASAQTFTNSIGGSIKEVNIQNFFPIEVSGLPPVIDSTSFGLVKVCFHIEHSYVGDLDVLLQSPDNTVINIANNYGGSQNNYYETCVAENATDGELADGVAPFYGTFYPNESLNLLNNGQNPNGIWYLVVIDEMPQDTGKLLWVSLTFDNDPPPTHTEGDCKVGNAAACQCPDGTNECDLLPNMINSANYISQNWTEKVGFIRLGVATPNIGYGPLEVHGTGECYCDSIPADCAAPCPDGKWPKEKVIQVIYHKSDAAMTSYSLPAGTMTYHPTHGHIHVDDWTHNSIRIRGPDSNPATWPIVAQSEKVSFCLVNLGNCSSSNQYCVDKNGIVRDKNNLPNFGLGLHTGCDYDQGIYVGKYDAYHQYIEGQEIYFDSLCNGTYYIVSVTNPTKSILESDYDDNAVAVEIKLKKQGKNCCTASFRADVTYGLAPLQVAFMDSTVPVAHSWLWDFGDGATSTSQFPTHVYTAPGVYTVKLITQGSTGCTDTAIKADYIVVDVATQAEPVFRPQEIRLHISPNPFTELATVEVYVPQALPARLALCDLAGAEKQLIAEGFLPAGVNRWTLHGASIAEGMYLLQATVAGTRHVCKVMRWP